MSSKDDKLVCHYCKQEIEEREYNIFTLDGKVYHGCHLPEKYRGTYRSDNYNKYCNKDNIFLKDNNTFEIIKSKRTFGIELETSVVLKDNDTLWGSKTDCTVSGKEFVSPVLQGDNGIKEIKRFLDKTKCLCGGSTGYHLHIGTDDYSPISLMKLSGIHLKLEEYFYELVSGDRYFNSWCFPLGHELNTKVYNTLDKILPRMFDVCTPAKIKKPIACIKEIKTNQTLWGRTNFNYCNSLCGGRRTMEVRLHHGTWNFKEIANWIILNTAIVDYAKDNSNAVIRKRMSTINNRKDFLLFIEELCNKDIAKFYAKQMIKYWGINKKEVDYGRTEKKTRRTTRREPEHCQLAV